MFRAVAVGVALVVVLATSACTKSDEATSSPTAAASVADIDVPQGDYGWAAYGVTATLVPGQDSWTLDIKNASGEKLGAPGIYALASDDGHQIDATVEDSQPLADGAEETLNVVWPQDFDPKNVGMVLLLMGDELYGGFERGR